jgi:hypothetical protein
LFAATATPAILELSVRHAARVLKVSADTAFRWRHLLCGALANSEAPPLRGWIELTHILFAESRKGQNVEGRRPRRRGVWPLIAYRGRLVTVQVAADKTGNVLAAPFGGDLNGLAWLVLLQSRIRAPAGLVAEFGPLGRYGSLAQRIGVPYLDARTQKRASRFAHVETASRFCRRLCAWMRRFRGVASSYLPHYLAWFGWLDRGVAFPSEPYRWPVGT